MFTRARLEHDLDTGLAHIQPDALAQVRDLDHVGAGIGDLGQQPGQPAGAIGHAREEDVATTGLALATARQLGQ